MKHLTAYSTNGVEIGTNELNGSGVSDDGAGARVVSGVNSEWHALNFEPESRLIKRAATRQRVVRKDGCIRTGGLLGKLCQNNNE